MVSPYPVTKLDVKIFVGVSHEYIIHVLFSWYRPVVSPHPVTKLDVKIFVGVSHEYIIHVLFVFMMTYVNLHCCYTESCCYLPTDSQPLSVLEELLLCYCKLLSDSGMFF